MKRAWPLHDAKNKLSEVVDRAIEEGPQTITRRGREAAVVVSARDFRQLTRPKDSLISFFRNSPLASVDLDLERVDDYGRKVDL
ncbi:MAG: type II toxin-antitoxin system Phd/YefM family antitoxin [Vicinamibacteria bacterium]